METVMLFLQATSQPLDWGQLGNLTASTLMGFLFWHVVTRGMPAIVERFTNEMAAARADFRAALDKVVEHCREENKTTIDAVLRAVAATDNKRTKDMS